jgi:mRNA interferase RelE/StbE
MVVYEVKVIKSVEKGLIPKNIMTTIDNAFSSLDLTKDFSLFDIRKLKGDKNREYYRLRKGKYRALFYTQDTDIYVYKIHKREDAYK